MKAVNPIGWAIRILATIFLIGTGAVEAHPARASAVLLDVGETAVRAELQVPLDQLGMALEGRPDAPPPPVTAAPAPPMVRYVTAHFGLTAGDGRAYSYRVESAGFDVIDDADHLKVVLLLTPPPEASTNLFEVHDDVILHRVVSHKIFVSIRRDFRAGLFAERLEPLGILMYQQEHLTVSRSRGSLLHGFESIFLLGMRHIAEGTDHLLFLLVLLLAAPLLAEGGRWRQGKSAWDGLRAVVGIVTAFTLGHSLTLVLAGSGLLRLPAAPVEIAIACSILVSSVHVIRPIFAGRENLIAAGFGLAHGLAFATFLAGFGFDPRSLAISLLGFNLGIEAMQLLIVAMVVPGLLILGRTRVYTLLRTSGALFAGVAALGWIGQRAFGWANPTATWIDAAFIHWKWGLAALIFAAALARLTAQGGIQTFQRIPRKFPWRILWKRPRQAPISS